jgi:glycosyltransferase involved in cell wall biosynthesis
MPETIGEPSEPPHVLFAGRLSKEKGILEFLEATRGMRRVIVGDGPLRPHVPEAIGFVPPAELGPYYERAAVVCVPSRREGYGMVAREAMAYGRPVVATRAGGLLDAVVDGETGILVAPGDVEALAHALRTLLADEGRRARLGRGGREKVLREAPASAVADGLLAVYASALG